MPPIDVVSPKSADDPRSRRYSIGLPIEIELFYAAQGEFVRDVSTTRTMEQFLTDRATNPDNIEDLRRRITFRALSQNKSVSIVLREFLTAQKYDKMAGLDLEGTITALCELWNIENSEDE